MALADILERLAADAAEESARIARDAEERAEAVLAHARADAARTSADALERAKREATTRAQTLRATARLAARDRALAKRGELIEEALDGVVAALAALPDDAYASFVAGSVADVARGGETVLVADADRERLAGRLRDALSAAAPDLELTWSDEPAPVERGVFLRGERVSVDLSIDAVVASRRDDLAMTVARTLFGEREK